MLIGGLWHGANWTFVIWGLYHGLLLIAHRSLAVFWGKLPAVVRQFAMLILACVGWVLFRAADFDSATELLRRMFIPTSGASLTDWFPFFPVLACAAFWAMWGPNCFDLFQNYVWRRWHGPVFAILFGICVGLIVGGGNSPFLYFQF